MVALTIDLELPESVAAYLSSLPRAEQNRFVVSALMGAYHNAADGELEEGVHPNVTALLSQATLAEDWDRPEENSAWYRLQSGQ